MLWSLPKISHKAAEQRSFNKKPLSKWCTDFPICLQVTVLEASERVGGRVRTYRNDKEGWYANLGPMRLPDKHRWDVRWSGLLVSSPCILRRRLVEVCPVTTLLFWTLGMSASIKFHIFVRVVQLLFKSWQQSLQQFILHEQDKRDKEWNGVSLLEHSQGWLS